MKRILTAAALIPIVVYVVLWANFWAFLAVLVTVAFLCYREFNDVAAAYGFGAPGPLGYGAGVLLLAWPQETWLLVVGIALILLALAMSGDALAKSLPRAALLLAVAATFWLARLFKQRIGGYTGDCLGATQQLAEVAFYGGLLYLFS